MSEYEVRHIKSSDGTTIAAASAGVGFPVLFVPVVTGVVQTFLWSAIQPGFRVVTYDRRGTGMSGNGPNTPSEVYIDDIEAVAESLGVQELAVVGDMFGAPEAMALAARRPDLCTHLVLRTPIQSHRDWVAIPRIRALLSVIDDDWPFLVNALVRSLDWDNPRAAGHVAQAMDHWTPAQLRRLVDGLLPLDVEQQWPRISAKTLLIHDPKMFFPESYSREIASSIPRCTMTILPSVAGQDRRPHLNSLTWEYLAPLAEERGNDGAGRSQSFQTILFTDLESSTALTQRLGDEGAQEVLRGHNTTVRKALEAHGGREVKHTGDGIMAAFPSAVRAVEAALQVQRDLAGGEVRVRIGLNAGEPIAEDDDLFGTAVQLAARICDRAEPGQVQIGRAHV